MAKARRIVRGRRRGSRACWLDEIAKTFVIIAAQPFPSATPTIAPRLGARQAADALVSAFAARDAAAVARVMPDCWLSVVYAIDETIPGPAGPDRSVAQSTLLLRERSASGDLTVTVDPAPAGQERRGREEYLLRSRVARARSDHPDRAAARRARYTLALDVRDTPLHGP